jgi:hypothetical protein
MLPWVRLVKLLLVEPHKGTGTKTMSWQAAAEAEEELRQRKRQWQGWLNQRQGTGGRISPRHETHHEVRPSDIDPNIQPGGKSDKWALTPSGGSGIRQTLRGDPSAFTGGAYQAALANAAARHRGGAPRPQRRHAQQRAAYSAAVNQQRAQAEEMQRRRMAAPHMGQAMANQYAARAFGNQGQPMGQPMGGVMGQGPVTPPEAWGQAHLGGQPAGGSHWDHRREMTRRRLEGADARHLEALNQSGITRDLIPQRGFGNVGLGHGGQGAGTVATPKPPRRPDPFGAIQGRDPYDILDEDYIENMYG